MKNATKLLELGILGSCLYLSGCEDPIPQRVKMHQSGQIVEEDKHRTENDISSKVEEVEMEVTDVQLGQIGYYFGSNESGVALNHPFQYVIGKGNDNKDHIFIYPISTPILRKHVSFKSNPLSRGAISVNNFLKDYVRIDVRLTSLNYDIPAEGVIQIGSLAYREKK
ncbi:MAG: hypothetical protein AABX83_00515 [Nanoarchaeota archaeon]